MTEFSFKSYPILSFPGSTSYSAFTTDLGMFRNPPIPQRTTGLCLQFPDPDFLYEGGFKVVPPSMCHLQLDALIKEFTDQIALQDKRNIDIARGKYKVSRTKLSDHSVKGLKWNELVEPAGATLPTFPQLSSKQVSPGSVMSSAPPICMSGGLLTLASLFRIENEA